MISKLAVTIQFIKIGGLLRIGGNESHSEMEGSENLILKWEKIFQIFWYGEKMEYQPTNLPLWWMIT
jgi:hypothetical protein